jgi:tetratricopeptide (TPR) repeat protein
MFFGMALCASSRANSEELPAELPVEIQKSLKKAAANPGINYEVKLWLKRILRGKYRDAAHRWEVTRKQAPEELQNLTEASYLFLLWNMDLPQTFVQAYLRAAARTGFLASVEGKSLSNLIAKPMDRFLDQNGIRFTPEQRTILDSQKWEGPFVYMKAWDAFRDGKRAAVATKHLSADHPWQVPFDKTLALAKLRQGDMDGAIKIYKDRLTKTEDEEMTSEIHLQLGRIFYQAAELDEAEKHYQLVSEDSPEFLTAREELIWVWLRTGNMPKLRGTLISLTLPQFRDKLMPEVLSVRAISNIKLCYYEQARQDFEDFITYNKEWARRIDEQLKAKTPEKPLTLDFYAAVAMRGMQAIEDETASVEKLLEESLAASLPAVGVQSHWKAAENQLRSNLSRVTKIKDAEYRRYWRNASVQLQEAIRKMRFVRIELVSQLRKGFKPKPNSEVSTANAKDEMQKVSSNASGKWSFPFDGVVWPDEEFSMQSVAPNVCL